MIFASRWRLLAILLLVPAGGPLAVWLAARATAEAAPGELDADGYGSMATDDELDAARRKGFDRAAHVDGGGLREPPAPPTLISRDALADAVGLHDDPIFVDPTLEDRFLSLYCMIAAYVGKGPEDRLGRNDQIPTEEQLKAWFLALSPRQRVAIDWKFNDRGRYTEYVRDCIRRAKDGGKVDLSRPMGGAITKLYADPGDVFVSPRDGLPFRIGRDRDPRVVIRERRGSAEWDRRYLEERPVPAYMGRDKLAGLLRAPATSADRIIPGAPAPEVRRTLRRTPPLAMPPEVKALFSGNGRNVIRKNIPIR